MTPDEQYARAHDRALEIARDEMREFQARYTVRCEADRTITREACFSAIFTVIVIMAEELNVIADGVVQNGGDLVSVMNEVAKDASPESRAESAQRFARAKAMLELR